MLYLLRKVFISWEFTTILLWVKFHHSGDPFLNAIAMNGSAPVGVTNWFVTIPLVLLAYALVQYKELLFPTEDKKLILSLWPNKSKIYIIYGVAVAYSLISAIVYLLVLTTKIFPDAMQRSLCLACILVSGISSGSIFIGNIGLKSILNKYYARNQ